MQTKFNQCLSCIFNGCFRNNIVFQQAFESLKMEIWSTYSMNMFKNTSLNWGTILAVETSGNVTLKYKDMDFLVITSMINKLDNNSYLIHFKQKLNLSIRTCFQTPGVSYLVYDYKDVSSFREFKTSDNLVLPNNCTKSEFCLFHFVPKLEYG